MEQITQAAKAIQTSLIDGWQKNDQPLDGTYNFSHLIGGHASTIATKVSAQPITGALFVTLVLLATMRNPIITPLATVGGATVCLAARDTFADKAIQKPIDWINRLPKGELPAGLMVLNTLLLGLAITGFSKWLTIPTGIAIGLGVGHWTVDSRQQSS